MSKITRVAPVSVKFIRIFTASNGKYCRISIRVFSKVVRLFTTFTTTANRTTNLATQIFSLGGTNFLYYLVTDIIIVHFPSWRKHLLSPYLDIFSSSKLKRPISHFQSFNCRFISWNVSSMTLLGKNLKLLKHQFIYPHYKREQDPQNHNQKLHFHRMRQRAHPLLCPHRRHLSFTFITSYRFQFAISHWKPFGRPAPHPQ